MGAWGPGLFENDAALDFLDALTEAEDVTPLREALAAGAGKREDYLEADRAQAALAAAEVVACLCGHPGTEPPEELLEWLPRARPASDPVLLAAARAAVARVARPPSELLELWEESGDQADWQSAIADLAQRLEKS